MVEESVESLAQYESKTELAQQDIAYNNQLLDWDPLETVAKLRQGVPYATFEGLCQKLNISQKSMATYLGLNIRTLTRRKKTGILTTDESERVIRALRLLDLTSISLEDKNRAVSWLKKPKVALGQVAPITLLDTAFGAKEVENLLEKMESGELI